MAARSAKAQRPVAHRLRSAPECGEHRRAGLGAMFCNSPAAAMREDRTRAGAHSNAAIMAHRVAPKIHTHLSAAWEYARYPGRDGNRPDSMRVSLLQRGPARVAGASGSASSMARVCRSEKARQWSGA